MTNGKLRLKKMSQAENVSDSNLSIKIDFHAALISKVKSLSNSTEDPILQLYIMDKNPYKLSKTFNSSSKIIQASIYVKKTTGTLLIEVSGLLDNQSVALTFDKNTTGKCIYWKTSEKSWFDDGFVG